MTETGSPLGVWRVSLSGRVGGYLLAGGPALGAVITWFSALIHPSAQNFTSAGISSAVALGFGLFAWWVLLRVRLELHEDVIVMVNPWGTQRLPWSRVSAVSLGNWGAEFHTTDGFKYTAYALSDLAGGTRQDVRFAGVRRVVRARLRREQPEPPRGR
ncbi:PH domain-containing protein [Streptomyces gilvus]|uniref:PH domain-containing protein n=1 Tax=Streptomyces gilvus TaxID=2920937 RepID=UPI001F0D8AB9|nr:PH domain-containing protein [Streptomyces sp. CME 23]MCH5672474.1 PH domain-containing protein [Streptomyces sp. CME 23]